MKAKRSVAKAGKGLRVNHPSVFSSNCFIGDYCNFNGMKAYAGG